MRGTTSSASGTASFPPAQKSYCMSTTRSTSFSLVCMGTSLGKGSGASLESWKPVYNDINGNGTHDVREFPLVLKYRAEGSALQFINYGRRNATREINAAAGLQCHGRIAGNTRQPRDKMVQGFCRRRVLPGECRLNDGFRTGQFSLGRKCLIQQIK